MPAKGKPDKQKQRKAKKETEKTNNGVLIAVAVIGAAATIVAAVISVIIPLVVEKQATPTGMASETALSSPLTQTPPAGTMSTPGTVLAYPATPEIDEILDERGASMMLVSEGEFTMGSNRGEINEQPIQTLYLASFYMDKYEVTNAQYRACVSVKVCDPPGDTTYYQNAGYTDHPVTFVDWYMAEAYCVWRGARLPTEAEWEKAARGIQEVAYPWGDTIDCSYTNYRGENGHCVGDSLPVGSYESGKSVFGIYDLAGNVLEWVSSAYADYPYDPNDGREGLNISSLRVIRGGSWNNKETEVRTTTRAWAIPSRAEFDFGFRCAKDAP